MSALQIVFGVFLILLAIAIIVLVMMQEGNQQGLSGAISGGSSESFFGKNKSRTNEAKVSFITKILAGVFFVLALVASIVMLFVK
ncbi:MAG: preprotein translocase subunit SecG [Oscillospiraceae bacterium]|nr:preprotein translocase subunit SecG [Oscillospiraceae bacterium]